MKLALACKCGGAARGVITPDIKAEEFERKWWAVLHSDPDCGPVTPKEARKARAKEERGMKTRRRCRCIQNGERCDAKTIREDQICGTCKDGHKETGRRLARKSR